MRAVRNLFSYTKPYRIFVLLAPLLMALEVTMDLLQPMFMQTIIDDGIANGELSYVIEMGIYMLLAAIVGLVGGIGCTVYSTKAAVNVASDIRNDLFNKALHFSSENRDAIGIGKMITIITSDVALIQHALMMTLRVFVRGPLLFIGSIIIVFFQARELFPIIIVTIPILLLCITYFSKKAGKWFKKVQEGLDMLNTKLQQSIAGIRVIKAFVRKDYEIQTFKKINDHLTNRTIAADKLMTFLMPILLFIINIGIIVALLLGVIPIGQNEVQIGVILAFINYLNIILMALMSSSTVLMQLMRAFPSAERVQNLLETKPRIRKELQNESIKLIEGDLEFRDVCFAYEENGENVLEHLSFTVNKGEKVGIIGPTGSGKTTLIKLFPRLYDPTHGEILLNGRNIKEYHLDEYRSLFGYISQKASLFSGSIASNLKFGRTNTTNEQLHLATVHACASEFIEKFDDKLEHPLTQGATNLSGGQKQRLSIARALVRNPSILILDDVTSAVDAHSESSILNTLQTVYKEKTQIIVASKISSIKHADKILVIDDGMIVGEGTHEQLLDICPLYQEIYATQTDKGGVAVE